jgi:Cu-Zn family superoxide dismutase
VNPPFREQEVQMHTHRAAALVAAIVLAACRGQPRGPGGEKLEAPSARASLIDSSGAEVGVATFSQSDGGAQLSVSVSGLTPGRHGMHVPHAGDLPNLVVEDDGSADTTLTVPASLLAQGPGSMIGTQQRAFVIHADPDDEKTDPSGNSGARVVCGVIEQR